MVGDALRVHREEEVGGRAVKIAFRVDCPKCRWGFPMRQADINVGYLVAKCEHCENIFYYRIIVSGIEIIIHQDLPEGAPPPRGLPHPAKGLPHIEEEKN